MKKSSKISSYLRFALVAAILLIASSVVKPQVNVEQVMGSVEVKYTQTAVKNLLVCIESENPGVSRSAIYYAGYYKVMESLPALISQLKKEKNPSTRILIALSLYKLGDLKGLDVVKDYSQKDPDSKVRRMCSVIYTEYSLGQGKVAKK